MTQKTVDEKLLDWARENGIDGTGRLSVTDIFRQVYSKGGDVAVKSLSCPPDYDPDTWRRKKEDFLINKVFGVDGWITAC